MTRSRNPLLLWRTIAAALAASAAVLLAADAIAEDPALFLGGLTLIGLAVTVFFLGGVPDLPAGGDFWENVAWGKLFVGFVYASLTFFILLAFLHTPEVAHFIARL